jgi:hypothetical protein
VPDAHAATASAKPAAIENGIRPHVAARRIRFIPLVVSKSRDGARRS